MRFGTASRNVAERKNRIGFWISSYIVRARRVYHRRMCHQMHQQQIYYAVTCQLIRPCHHIIGYVCKCVNHILFWWYFCSCWWFFFHLIFIRFLFVLIVDMWMCVFGFFSPLYLLVWRGDIHMQHVTTRRTHAQMYLMCSITSNKNRIKHSQEMN